MPVSLAKPALPARPPLGAADFPPAVATVQLGARPSLVVQQARAAIAAREAKAAPYRAAAHGASIAGAALGVAGAALVALVDPKAPAYAAGLCALATLFPLVLATCVLHAIADRLAIARR